MVTIYYKDNQLDKYRTAKSILKYYFREFREGRTPQRIIVERSLAID